jgi:hypothetical protein
MATFALLVFLFVDLCAVLFALHRLHTHRVESDRTDARYRIRYR